MLDEDLPTEGPRRVEALSAERIVGVAAGFVHSLALSAAGVLWSWGGGKHEQLGHGDFEDRTSDRTQPLPVCSPRFHSTRVSASRALRRGTG